MFVKRIKQQFRVKAAYHANNVANTIENLRKAVTEFGVTNVNVMDEDFENLKNFFNDLVRNLMNHEGLN